MFIPFLPPVPIAAYAPIAADTPALTIGGKAPDFALPDENGKIQRLSDYRGRTVVIMFYPKDFTPG